MSAWHPSEITKLRELAAKGLSAGVIAAQLNRQFGNGRSRNAVIGKIVRGKGQYGRLLRPSGIGTHGVPHGKANTKPHSAASSLGRAEQTGAALPRAAPVTLPATRPMRFLDAMFSDRCLHFVGDVYSPAGPDMPVCGAERAQDAGSRNRYCCRHLASQRQAREVA